MPTIKYRRRQRWGSASGPAFIDTVQYDDSGRVAYISQRQGSDTTHLHFYYTANNELASRTLQHGYNDLTTVSTYQYTNGDITAQFDHVAEYPQNADTLYFTYYTDHAFSFGDCYAWQEFGQYCASWWRSAHLLKSVSEGGYIQNATYSFDAQGRVTGLHIITNWGPNSQGTEYDRFVYPCNP